MTHTGSWPEDPTVLRLARRVDRCGVLGPGIRAVLWVQGCPLRCPGCVATETLPFSGGEVMGVEILAKELLGLPGIDGITFSGGEPTSQAAALCRLIDLILSCRDLSMMAYTGFTLDYLRAHGSPSQQALLDRLDILIDGPFVAARHTDLRWRGSDNQSVHFLTSRHEDLRHLALDRGRWLELTMDQDGSLGWMGVPPPGFREAFEQSLARQGILVNGGLEYEQFPEV